MIKNIKFFVTVLLSLIVAFGFYAALSPVKAEDKKSTERLVQKEQKPAEDKKETPVTSSDDKKNERATTPVTEWIAAENKLIDTLSKESQETFFVIRNKHSVIRALRVVHSDIASAVKGCGGENPDYKSDIDARLKDWENAVFPILKEAEKFLKQEIKTQKIVHVSDFNYILSMNDKAYEYTNKTIEKRPVTDLESCKKLTASMDYTENELISLLQNILLPEEVVRKRLEQAEKEKTSSEEASKQDKKK